MQQLISDNPILIRRDRIVLLEQRNTVLHFDLWTFRDLDFSRVVLSRPMIGPFATRYFSHLFDPSRFATSVIFAVCRQITVNYSLTTSCIQSFLLISISRFYFRTIKVVL